MTKQKHYSLKKILSLKAVYNLIFGERGNGKTYSCLKLAVETFFKNGKQFAYLRRWETDIKGQRGSRVFGALIANDEISKITKGEFTGVHYWNRKFYLCNYDEFGKAIYNERDLLGFSFSLSEYEHDKSASFPDITTIIFDEFIAAKLYLGDNEFSYFMNVLSTIIRKRTDVTIFLLGNTVNKYCPYFKEMGLTHILRQEQGSIVQYSYGESNLTVAVEYCSPLSIESAVNKKYFAFDNPKLKMITSGAWELGLYPHLPYKYKPKDIIFKYYILFDSEIYQANIIELEQAIFTYIHIKTTEIKDSKNSLIYTLDYKPERNYHRNILKPALKIHDKIKFFFINDKVFYQNNSVGNAIENYLKLCRG